MVTRPERLDLVLPVHNEAETIVATIDAWLAEAARLGVDLQVLACEDGSSDGSGEVLERAAATRPLTAIIGTQRKGYSRAVVDGIRASTAPVVCCIDSDGQCDPADLGSVLDAWEASPPVAVGIRSPRQDPLARRLMSGSVRLVVRALHGVRLQDPSCPFVVVDGPLARSVAESDPILDQGYWWEFHVRLRNRGVRPIEVPVHHRARLAGTTRVYLPANLPRIASTHLVGLWRLRGED